MLLFTIRFGRLLLMMGRHSRAESLFYYFRLEDQVPENHSLRLIDRHIKFQFIRAKLKDAYSDAGKPSIDPELLLRMLLVGYLYGVTSEKTGGRATHASGVASVAARDMIERYRQRYGYLPQTLAADTTYGNGELLQWLDDRGIAAYVRVKENPNGPTDLYGVVLLHAGGEQLYLPGRQSPEVRRNQCAQPHPRLFYGEALSRVLAKEPPYARQVSDDRHPCPEY